MKSTELRIGNYFSWEGVDTVFKLSHFQDRLLYPNDIHKYQPIPLTEECLLKFDKANEFFMVDKLGFVIFKNSYVHQFVREDYEYVHQLQNLYFALTVEELIYETKDN